MCVCVCVCVCVRVCVCAHVHFPTPLHGQHVTRDRFFQADFKRFKFRVFLNSMVRETEGKAENQIDMFRSEESFFKNVILF